MSIQKRLGLKHLWPNAGKEGRLKKCEQQIGAQVSPFHTSSPGPANASCLPSLVCLPIKCHHGARRILASRAASMHYGPCQGASNSMTLEEKHGGQVAKGGATGTNTENVYPTNGLCSKLLAASESHSLPIAAT